MRVRIPLRGALIVSAVAALSTLACVNSPGPPTKATQPQIDLMNQEVGGGSGSFGVAPPDWPAMSKAIRTPRDSADRLHWIGEFAYHAAALPESLRTLRFAELQQLLREVR